jgi:hypothetical protein
MRRKKLAKLEITTHSRFHKDSQSEMTKFVQVKNGSQKDAMSAVDFVYHDTGSANKKRLHLSDLLSSQKVVKLDCAQAGISAKIVDFQIMWKFQGIAYGSQVHAAKSGYYFYSITESLKPDGSSESNWLVQHTL